MKPLLKIAVAFAMLAVTTHGRAADVIDRIVAVVDRTPILLSDWQSAIQFEAFMQQRREPASNAERRAALDRLIDQQLLIQQMRSPMLDDSDAVRERLQQLRRDMKLTDDSAWQRSLNAYNLTEDEVRHRIAIQLETLRYIDLRLRPGVHVAREDIENYYREQFVPRVVAMGSTPEPLTTVSSRIEEILTQAKMDDMLSNWLRSLREQVLVTLSPDVSSNTGASRKSASGTVVSGLN